MTRAGSQKYVGAIDQGTTSTRCILFDRAGAIVAREQIEHAQICPGPGLVEHDALEIWRNVQACVSGALANAGLGPGNLAAVGLTNQRETCLVWNRRTGAPLHNALVWMDMRTSDLVAQFSREGGQDRLRASTGLPLASYFSGLKLRWLLDHIEGARDAAARGDALFGTIDSWIAWNLTGGVDGGAHVTDVTNASRTQLMNLRTLAWDEAILDLFGIPPACLPEIRSSSEIFGAIPALGGTPLSGMLGDQQAALFGQACLRPGQAKNTYGTGCFVLMNTGETPFVSKCGLLTTLAYQLGETKPVYALEGSIAVAGALTQWLRDNLGLIDRTEDIEALARSVPDNGDVYFVPAFSGLFAPHWRPDARGIIAGLTRFANKGHIARAALEASAYQTAEVLAAMTADSAVPISQLRVDGAMTANELLMQFQADMLDAPVTRPEVIETTALGAAYAAGLAVGYWRGVEDIEANWRIGKTWGPQLDAETRGKLFAGWTKALERSKGWVA